MPYNAVAQCFTVKLNSVEEMNDVLHASAWELNFQQLELGQSPVNVTSVSMPSSVMLKVVLTGKAHQIGAVSERAVTFGLPSKSQPDIQFQDGATTSDALSLFDPSSGLDAVSGENFSAYTVSFDVDYIEKLLLNMGIDSRLLLSPVGNRHVSLDPKTLRALRTMLEELTSLATDRTGEPGLGAIQAVETELAKSLVGAFCVGCIPAVTPYPSRSKALSRALSYVYENATEAVDVVRVCNEAGCSLSTLERAFQERFGVTPKRYLTATRLSGLRRDLLAADPGSSTVGQLASGWDFWHLSKLAADYKRMYGELPSQTLRAAG